jgi:hypothetical protein
VAVYVISVPFLRHVGRSDAWTVKKPFTGFLPACSKASGVPLGRSKTRNRRRDRQLDERPDTRQN